MGDLDRPAVGDPGRVRRALEHRPDAAGLVRAAVGAGDVVALERELGAGGVLGAGGRDRRASRSCGSASSSRIAASVSA